MPLLYEIQMAPWDQVTIYLAKEELQIKDKVVLKTDQGQYLATVLNKFAVTDADFQNKYANTAYTYRQVNTDDLDRQAEHAQRRKADLDLCQTLIKERHLSMKIIDVIYSLDGGRMTFAFVSNARIDFRVLIKDLINHFHKTPRLQQIGARDAARVLGEIGACGIEQCCRTHLRALPTITIEMAEVQQVANRGTDRVSGMCGRLKCCLLYELETYKQYASNLPALGQNIIIKHEQKAGTVIARNILKQTVRVTVAGTETPGEFALHEIIIAPQINQSATPSLPQATN